MGLFGEKKMERVYAGIVDIRSGSIGIGIVASEISEATPTVVFETRIPLQFKDTPTPREYFKLAKATLSRIESHFKEEGTQQLLAFDSDAEISEVLVTCSSPWSHTVTRSIFFEKDEPFKVTKGLIADLVEEAEDESGTTHKESQIAGSAGFDVTDRRVTEMRANGYAVKDAVGHVVSSVQFSQISSLMATDITNLVYNFTARIFPKAKGQLRAYMSAFGSVMKEVDPDLKTFCAIDISGEATEIAVVKDGVVQQTTFIPYGTTTLIRNISRADKNSEHDSASRLRAYSEKTIAVGDGAHIGEQLRTYQKNFTEAVEKLHETHHIPSSVVVSMLPGTDAILMEQIAGSLSDITKETHTFVTLEGGILAEIARDAHDGIIAVLARSFHENHR